MVGAIAEFTSGGRCDEVVCRSSSEATDEEARSTLARPTVVTKRRKPFLDVVVCCQHEICAAVDRDAPQIRD